MTCDCTPRATRSSRLPALAPIQAASKARLMRNALIEAARLSSSDIGKAAAVAEKASGLSMEALLRQVLEEIVQ